MIRRRATVRNRGMNITRIQFALGLSIALTAGSARAQTPIYSVEAKAMTGGTPGNGTTHVGPLVGEVSAHAVNDPPATQWIHNYYQVLFSDALAETWTDIGSLTTHAYALAQRVQATNFPAGVTAQTYAKFIDRIFVTSDTLPVGTVVYLTFGNELTVDWQGTSVYDGNANCMLQIGGLTSYSRFSAAYNKAAVNTAAAPLVVKTSVGNSISLTGRLDTLARGSFFVSGPLFDGEMTIDATCDTPLLSVTPGVQLVSESGVDYAAL